MYRYHLRGGAGGAVVGAGGTASAATAEHVQRPAVSVAADNHRSGGGHEHNWDRSDDRRWGRDIDYRWDRNHDYRSDRDHDHCWGRDEDYRSDRDYRWDRDHDYRWDRGDGHRRDQGTSSSWGDRGGDRYWPARQSHGTRNGLPTLSADRHERSRLAWPS